MKPTSTIFAAAIIASGLLAVVCNASAQTITGVLKASEEASRPALQIAPRIITGVFKSSEGNKGSYQRTIEMSDGPFVPGHVVTPGGITTDTIVYTRDSDGLTRTTIKISSEYPDGSHTVSMSSTDWGATTPYTAQKTLTNVKHDQFVGHGTYTTANGDTGILTTIETNYGGVSLVTSLLNSPTTGITQVLDTEDESDGLSVNKEVILSPNGTPTSVVIKRFATDEKGVYPNPGEA